MAEGRGIRMPPGSSAVPAPGGKGMSLPVSDGRRDGTAAGTGAAFVAGRAARRVQGVRLRCGRPGDSPRSPRSIVPAGDVLFSRYSSPVDRPCPRVLGLPMSIAKEHRWLLLAVCAAQFFMPFMVAGVNAVLPPLGKAWAPVRASSACWGPSTLGLVVFQLAGGTLGDIYGRRRIFLFGLSLFSVLALVLGFIPYIDLFIGLRLFQGMGGRHAELGQPGPAGVRRAQGDAGQLSGPQQCGRLRGHRLRAAGGRPCGRLAGLALAVLGHGPGRLEQADGLVLGSPVYFGNVTGAMRSFQERLCFPYVVYDRQGSTIAPRRLATACIYTMNVDAATMRQYGYPATLAVMEGYLGRIFSEARRPLCERYLAVRRLRQIQGRPLFRGGQTAPARGAVPQDCRQAFVMGREMARKLAGPAA